MTTEQQALWKIPHSSVAEVFTSAAARAPDRVFCKSDTVGLTYAEADRAVSALAADLIHAKGRVVVLVLQNSPMFLVAYHAALRAGAAPALVNYSHPDGTIEKLVAGLDVAATLSDRDIPGLEVTRFDAEALRALLLSDKGLTATNEDPATPAAILFTGGTTGLPKQIAHSNKALLAKMEGGEWGWPSQDGDIWLPVAPFTHVYGFLMGVLNPTIRAGTLAIPPRFHPDVIVDMLKDEAVTVFGGGPPALYQAIMSSPKFADAAFPSLRIAPGGGAPFPLAVHRRWEAVTGLAIREGYGMTEIAPISINPPGQNKPGSAGKALPGTVIEIVDIQTGQDKMAVGETGEIRVKGPQMMTGYIGNEAETANALRDGFVYTGDIGRLDSDGFLTISDRKKDVVFVKGFNVFPREIEEVLMLHPAVTGACVVGRADDRAGEVPVAFITLDGAANDLETHCADHLADFKLPAEIILREELPLTPAGKVDRASLRAEASR